MKKDSFRLPYSEVEFKLANQLGKTYALIQDRIEGKIYHKTVIDGRDTKLLVSFTIKCSNPQKLKPYLDSILTYDPILTLRLTDDCLKATIPVDIMGSDRLIVLSDIETRVKSLVYSIIITTDEDVEAYVDYMIASPEVDTSYFTLEIGLKHNQNKRINYTVMTPFETLALLHQLIDTGFINQLYIETTSLTAESTLWFQHLDARIISSRPIPVEILSEMMRLGLQTDVEGKSTIFCDIYPTKIRFMKPIPDSRVIDVKYDDYEDLKFLPLACSLLNQNGVLPNSMKEVPLLCI